jgi:hypothetical protein
MICAPRAARRCTRCMHQQPNYVIWGFARPFKSDEASGNQGICILTLEYMHAHLSCC